jgi:hypothetical protein
VMETRKSGRKFTARIRESGCPAGNHEAAGVGWQAENAFQNERHNDKNSTIDTGGKAFRSRQWNYGLHSIYNVVIPGRKRYTPTAICEAQRNGFFRAKDIYNKLVINKYNRSLNATLVMIAYEIPTKPRGHLHHSDSRH